MTAPLPLALQLYTVREALANDWTGTLEQIAEMGFVGVETAGFGYAPSTDAAIAKINDLGLQIMAAHSRLPMGDNQQEIIDAVVATGCGRLIHAGTARDKFGNPADIKEQAALFNAANEVAKANGLSLGIHNHWWEYANVDGRSGIDILVEDLDDDIFFEIDTYWVQTARLDAADVVAKYSQRTPLLHIKDGPTGTASNMTAVGDGIMDFHKIIPAGKQAEWLVVELDRCATDMLTAVKGSINYLVNNGLGHGR